MTFTSKVLATREGMIFGVRILPLTGPGHTLIEKRDYSVQRTVEVNTSHPTNGGRGRTYRMPSEEARDQVFTTLILRAMSAPMDETELFDDIPGAW